VVTVAARLVIVAALLKTSEPLPVSLVIALIKLMDVPLAKNVAMLVARPLTPVEMGSPVPLASPIEEGVPVAFVKTREAGVPVALVSTRALGVPKLGVTRIGEVNVFTPPNVWAPVETDPGLVASAAVSLMILPVMLRPLAVAVVWNAPATGESLTPA